LFKTMESLLNGQVPSITASVNSKRSPAFDEAAFLSRMDGSYEVCAQITEAFFSECPRLMASLRTALQRKDAPELAGIAHALKGALANFTDGAAFQSAVKIEQLAKEADLHRAAEALQRLEDDVEALLQSLRAFTGAVSKA
jgi:HPt (histidine-containing phosphotransfer) domain-containing protein